MKKLLLVLLIVSNYINAQNAQTKHYNLENKVAIQGHDPVAYFKQNKAVKGKKEITASHDGVVYYFASQENKTLFEKNPTSFEPQYGGWCAYAMGENAEKVAINPTTFKILDGKLYLFYNAYFMNTLKSWNKDENKLKTKADANWKKIAN